MKWLPAIFRHPTRWMLMAVYVIVTLLLLVQLRYQFSNYQIQIVRKSPHLPSVNHQIQKPNISTVSANTSEARNTLADLLAQTTQHRQDHFVYVKVEKTGSSTFSNIFSSYGYRHGLNMLMSKVKGSLVNTREMFPGNNWDIGPNRDNPHLMEQHARYSYKFYTKFFPNNTAYITSIRDPVKWFISFIDFMKVYRGFTPRQVLEDDTLFHKTRNHVTGMQKQVHNNFLQWLGFEVSRSSSISDIQRHIDFIDKEFTLVMITEYFDESLVLLKRLMNWSMADIFYTYANEAVRKSGTVLTREEKEKLLDIDHNLGDWMLYQHFNRTFWLKVNKQIQFYDEVSVFKQLQVKVQEFCFSEELKKNKEIKLEIKTRWEKPFEIGEKGCLAIRVRDGKAEEFSQALDKYCPFRYQQKNHPRQRHKSRRSDRLQL